MGPNAFPLCCHSLTHGYGDERKFVANPIVFASGDGSSGGALLWQCNKLSFIAVTMRQAMAAEWKGVSAPLG